MITPEEHAELDNAVGTLPGMTPEQQRAAEDGAVWVPDLRQPNTAIRGTLPN